MRYLTIVTLGAAVALCSTVPSASQTQSDPRLQRCKSGLERGVAACNNMHDVSSDNWLQCVDYTIVTYQQCVAEVTEHMDTLPG